MRQKAACARTSSAGQRLLDAEPLSWRSEKIGNGRRKRRSLVR